MATHKVEETVEIEVNPDAFDELNKQMSNTLNKVFSTLGLNKSFNMASSMNKSSTGEGASIGGMTGPEGALIGASLGILLDLVGGIFDSLKDFPAITAIMKLIKLIFTILFLPLIPILKPLILLLSEFIKFMMPIIKTLSDMFTDQLKQFKAIGDAFNNLSQMSLKDLNLDKILDLFKPLGGLLIDYFNKYIISAIISVGKFILNIGSWLWNNYFSPAFSLILKFGLWIWNNYIVPTFSLFLKFGVWIWDTFISPAFTPVLNWAKWIWDTYFSPAFTPVLNWGINLYSILAGAITELANRIKSAISNIGSGISSGLSMFGFTFNNPFKSVSDAIITPNGIIQTDPNDYIIATKNPQGLGGNSAINVNINNTTVRDDSDIKKIVNQVQNALYTQMRRYNSYV
jgi:hypothetical protein